ncbi:hypothetical protein POM88_050540 [Heracleum sosnowskyi]|uniref:Uncharacterized protein n=1 Tax=Heracleum sosnowskyi TaxID=360622 RepID=A0AAD8H025_9APIA|nr:hypothetical protein POM88_050540 [Heracleum sosnowskyi]
MLVNGHNEDMELSNCYDKEKVDPGKPTSITWQRKVDSQRIPLSEFSISWKDIIPLVICSYTVTHGFPFIGLEREFLCTSGFVIKALRLKHYIHYIQNDMGFEQFHSCWTREISTMKENVINGVDLIYHDTEEYNADVDNILKKFNYGVVVDPPPTLQTSFIIYDGRLEGAIAKRTGGEECLLLLLSKDVLMLLQRLFLNIPLLCYPQCSVLIRNAGNER